jgi:3-hydroxyisobutyrate dehydrogenase
MRVGFIGIGNMGTPMAGHIVKGGHDVTAFDANAERAAQFASANGCRAAQGLADLASSEFVITMLPDGNVVRSVMLGDPAGEGGLARYLKPGGVLIDMSSSDPVGTRALGADLKALGIVMLDAPVSGAVPRATLAKLAIMIGGDDKSAIERAKPLLLCMGDRLFETGSLGTGHAMKALNNYIAAAGYTAAAEALLIGKRFGLDQSTMVDIVNASTGRNFITEMVLKEHVIGGKFATGFALGLLAKDVRIAADLGEAVKLDAPVSRLIRERWALARDRMGSTQDNSAAILGWDDELG